MNIQYNRTIWQNDQTALNAQHMNNVEEGILNIISAVNLIPNWVFSGTKPSYTASDVGADPAGTAASAVLTHNASVSAHSNVLAPKVHTHTLSAITNFPVVSASDNDKALTVVNGVWGTKKLFPVAFSGAYVDLSGKPTVPTLTSQLTNDSGYVTLDDIRRTMSGQWSGGAITSPTTFTCGFYPSYVTIVEKNSSGVTTDTRTINSDYSSGETSIIFIDTGFIAQSPENGLFNKTGYVYYWTAVSEGFRSLPSVTNADNGKVLTVVSGAWDAAVLPKELPTVTAVNNGKVLGVENGDWAIYTLPNQLPEVTVSDNEKMLTVVNGQWQAEYFNEAIYGVSGTTTLYSGSWSSNTYNISVASLGEYDAIFFSPITALDKSYLETANIIITTSGTTVTFTCVTSPTNNIGLNYFIARGKQ